ncbi:hypothetical protein M885DRAFT_625356 [Pelagophyceae sp. CCMP2097]|nr:hypothetical protein M885DRAFT_625356 [Pelagophyceae sp. CCMP2097]
MATPTRPRIELFFKSDSELRQRVRFLSEAGFDRFNVVHKDKRDTLAAWVATILEECPRADVCAHLSVKNLRVPRDTKTGDATFAAFKARIAELAALDGVEVLVVSGSRAAAPFDSASILERLGAEDAREPSGAPRPKVGVAFNPYLGGAGAGAREAECARLLRKVASDRVGSVWLQFGCDAALLADELVWLRGACPGTRVVGSVFLPTPTLLAQQKFRPWSGVLLDAAFLASPDAAFEATRRILAVYAAHGVDVLVEAPGVRKAHDLDLVQRLIFPASNGGDTP